MLPDDWSGATVAPPEEQSLFCQCRGELSGWELLKQKEGSVVTIIKLVGSFLNKHHSDE